MSLSTRSKTFAQGPNRTQIARESREHGGAGQRLRCVKLFGRHAGTIAVDTLLFRVEQPPQSRAEEQTLPPQSSRYGAGMSAA